MELERETEIKMLIRNRSEKKRLRFITALRTLQAIRLIALIGVTVTDAITAVSILGEAAVAAYAMLAFAGVELVFAVISLIRAPQCVFVIDKLVINAVCTAGILFALCPVGSAVTFAAVKGACCVMLWTTLAAGRFITSARRG